MDKTLAEFTFPKDVGSTFHKRLTVLLAAILWVVCGVVFAVFVTGGGKPGFFFVLLVISGIVISIAASVLYRYLFYEPWVTVPEYSCAIDNKGAVVRNFREPTEMSLCELDQLALVSSPWRYERQPLALQAQASRRWVVQDEKTQTTYDCRFLLVVRKQATTELGNAELVLSEGFALRGQLPDILGTFLDEHKAYILEAINLSHTDGLADQLRQQNVLPPGWKVARLLTIGLVEHAEFEVAGTEAPLPAESETEAK